MEYKVVNIYANSLHVDRWPILVMRQRAMLKLSFSVTVGMLSVLPVPKGAQEGQEEVGGWGQLQRVLHIWAGSDPGVQGGETSPLLIYRWDTVDRPLHRQTLQNHLDMKWSSWESQAQYIVVLFVHLGVIALCLDSVFLIRMCVRHSNNFTSHALLMQLLGEEFYRPFLAQTTVILLTVLLLSFIICCNY